MHNAASTSRENKPARPDGDPVARLLPLLFGLVGLGFLSAGTYVLYQRGVQASDAVAVHGEVIGLACGRGSRSTCSARVAFEYPPGQREEILSGVSSRPPAYAVGEHVTVLVSPRDGRARIDNFSERWGLPLFLLAFGGGFLFFAVLVGALMWPRKRTSGRKPRGAPRG